jgi:hypothetical protein
METRLANRQGVNNMKIKSRDEVIDKSRRESVLVNGYRDSYYSDADAWEFYFEDDDTNADKPVDVMATSRKATVDYQFYQPMKAIALYAAKSAVVAFGIKAEDAQLVSGRNQSNEVVTKDGTVRIDLNEQVLERVYEDSKRDVAAVIAYSLLYAAAAIARQMIGRKPELSDELVQETAEFLVQMFEASEVVRCAVEKKIDASVWGYRS